MKKHTRFVLGCLIVTVLTLVTGNAAPQPKGSYMLTLEQCLRDNRLTMSTQVDPQIQVVYIVFTHPAEGIKPVLFRVDGNEAVFVPPPKPASPVKDKDTPAKPAKPFKPNNK